MRLDKLARTARLKALSEEEDICVLLYNHEKTRLACRFFLEWLKNNSRQATRSEVSQFGRDLQDGKIKKGFRYSRKNFYRTVLRRLVDLGFVGLQPRWDDGRYGWKYVPIYQPIPKRPPGRRNFWHLAWQLCEKWNRRWEG